MRTFFIASILAVSMGSVAAQSTSQSRPLSAPHTKPKVMGNTPGMPAGQPQNQPPVPATTGPPGTTPVNPGQPIHQSPPVSPTTPARTASGTAPSVQQVTARVQRVSQASSSAPEPKVPAAAPMVSYASGELTVLAQNASLAEVLNAVRAATGIKIEGASGGAERVTAKIGPAPVRDVLLSLLEGSRYDFAMLSAADDTQRVERLVLTPRVASGSTSSVAAPSQPPAEQTAAPPQPGDDDDNEGFAEPAKPAPSAGGATVPANPVAIPAGPQQVKTPEQLLEDLRKLEAEKAQQQQQTTPDANAPRPPRPPK